VNFVDGVHTPRSGIDVPRSSWPEAAEVVNEPCHEVSPLYTRFDTVPERMCASDRNVDREFAIGDTAIHFTLTWILRASADAMFAHESAKPAARVYVPGEQRGTQRRVGDRSVALVRPDETRSAYRPGRALPEYVGTHDLPFRFRLAEA
jgi:hypothetical protein